MGQSSASPSGVALVAPAYRDLLDGRLLCAGCVGSGDYVAAVRSGELARLAWERHQYHGQIRCDGCGEALA